MNYALDDATLSGVVAVAGSAGPLDEEPGRGFEVGVGLRIRHTQAGEFEQARLYRASTA